MESKIITGRPLCFTTFHVDLASYGATLNPHPNANLLNQQYLRNIELLFRSVNLFHPHSRLLLLTSSNTDCSLLKMDYQCLNFEIDPNALMLSRLLAQQSLIHNNNFSTPIVLIDSDILLNGCLEAIFERDFDVALTWRQIDQMPINGGLIILNNLRPDAVGRFFDDYAKIYFEKYIEEANWYGDQLALKDLCGVTWQEMRDRELIEVNGCKILFLPCERYNFSPSNILVLENAPITEAVVLHFKGTRKHLMELYWTYHLQPRE